ncbi:MAG: acetate kinase [Candidatus Omnitrophica bacterium]|nr:acetate kinase [Candidatus Omnitrophota bacterium]
MKILTINCGSSSIKYKLFQMPGESLVAKGLLEKIGEETSFFRQEVANQITETRRPVKNHDEGLKLITESLLSGSPPAIKDIREIGGVGHRVVHGGEGFDRSVVITEDVIARIEEYQELAPLHNPPNLAGIKAARRVFSHCVQVASFDTAFHRTIPEVAYLYAIPFRFYTQHGIRRYGFHGTSHRYVARRAAELLGKGKYDLNAITCHLGNGCSVTAVRNGRSVDTSMGLTPLEGLIMGTRSGDIDPGVILFLAERLGIEMAALNRLLNRESGLLGISGTSNDFRNLLAEREKGNQQANLAIEMFCYRLRKYIGAYLAVLGQTDAIVFTGGIGENVPLVRERSLSNLQSLGIILDQQANQEAKGERIISQKESKIAVLVIPTDEELRIAVDTYTLAHSHLSG